MDIYIYCSMASSISSEKWEQVFKCFDVNTKYDQCEKYASDFSSVLLLMYIMTDH